MDLWHLWEGAPSLRACFAIVRISSGPPFLKTCVTLLHSNVFAGQSPTLPTIKPIKIYTIRILYSLRIMRESYACGLKTSIPRIKDNFSRLTQKSGQIVLDTWWLWHLIFGNVRKSSEIGRKSSEVAGTFPEISVMTRWKSHAFDSEKVGRYNIGM